MRACHVYNVCVCMYVYVFVCRSQIVMRILFRHGELNASSDSKQRDDMIRMEAYFWPMISRYAKPILGMVNKRGPSSRGLA